MSPELSRRVGAAMHAVDATFEEHVAGVNVLARVETEAELPGWLARLLIRGERKLSARGGP